MCFRPAGIELPEPDCPECGVKVKAVDGQYPKNCPQCNADFTQYEEEFKAKMAAATSGMPLPRPPGAPKPPAAPGAPSAPRPPAAPGAPKPPA